MLLPINYKLVLVKIKNAKEYSSPCFINMRHLILPLNEVIYILWHDSKQKFKIIYKRQTNII